MSKKLITLLLTVFIAVSSAINTVADGFPQQTLDSVVVVYASLYYEGEYVGGGWGTGFFIGKENENPEYLVTNHHVVESFLLLGSDSGSRIYVVYDKNDREECYIVDYNEEMDLALLRIGEPTSKRVAIGIEEPDNSMVGSDVFAIGYPGVSENVDPVSYFGKEDATVTRGTVSRLATQSGIGRRVVQTDADIHNGNSGGPLVNGAGNAIGVNSFGYSDESGSAYAGVNFAVSTQELIPILKRNNVEYYSSNGTSSGSGTAVIDDSNDTYTEGVSEPEADANTANNIADTVDTAEVPEPTTQAAQSSESTTNKIILAALVVIIFIAVIILIIWLTGRNNKNSKQAASDIPTQPIQPNPQPVHNSNPVIRSLSVQHNGMTVKLNSATITVGREANCQIRFNKDTPGISRQHCQIRWDEGTKEFVITDLNSSYGTFLSTGTRIPANVPYRLKAGSTIYLGDTANLLRFETE